LELVNSFGLSLVELDLTPHHESLSSLVESVTSLEKTAWSRGQFVAHTRTPSLYYCATLLSAHGKPAVILGTTNKDEGHYLGYVGKASDGLVDVQLISDLHKSEVFVAAHYLGVPASIVKATPNGALFDGKSDEEMFGASYEFVELYHYLKQLNELGKEMPVCPGYAKMASNLEALHSYNKHKYLSCSPAVHLDVLPDFCRYAQTWRTNLNFAKDLYYPQPTLRLDRIRGFEDSSLGLAVFKNSRLSAQDWTYPTHGYLVSDCSELSEKGEYAYAWVRSCTPSEIDGAAFEQGPLPVDKESWPLGRKALIVPLTALALDFGIDL
jgi:NAD+ synthetase